MKKAITPLIDALYTKSVFLRSIALVRDCKGPSRLFGSAVRMLTEPEIARLKSQGNNASDWKSISVARGFIPDRVVGNAFIGGCVIGVFDGTECEALPGLSLQCGIYRSTIINSEIGNRCCVYNTGMISNYVVFDGTALINTKTVSASGRCRFGNGRPISVGNETGGREILSCAEITIPVAAAVAMNRSDPAFLNSYTETIRRYTESCALSYGFIGPGCVVRDTTTITDAYIGEGALVNGALLVENSTVLSSKDEQTEISHGAFMRNSCAQWGCKVSSMAIVDESILVEHSHVERHAKVTHSIIGPNTSVAEGEVTSCLVGPFVGLHHQSLLIAALWPDGKGNVAYGANVGSNHTSKAPDQELWAGEGVFFGLGANVKFPSDFTDAPYTIIATGVDTLPQRMAFPFSLINKPSRQWSDISLACNELFPAWVLAENMYALLRNEGKFKNRDKARRTVVSFDVLRKDTVEKIATALNVLSAAPTKDLYTEKDIPGLGKNVMTAESRIKAMKTYEFYCRLYALGGLKKRIAELIVSGSPVKPKPLFGASSKDQEWHYQRQLLREFGYDRQPPKETLAAYIGMQEQMVASVVRSKEKDDIRGKAIIPDYAFVNTLAEDDLFITDLKKKTSAMKKEVVGMIKKMW